MFRRNDAHYQDDRFNHYHTMRPSVAKLLDKTWAPVFYEHVFCKINENLFAPMYSVDTSRPNTPVNILMSLEIIKNMFGCTDQELIEQFYFNFQINYALGIRNLGEVYLAERTLYEFRERVYMYILEHPDQDEVIFQQFEILADNFIQQSGVSTGEQRMDLTLITPNIKKAGRLSLAHDVLVKTAKAIPPNLLNNELTPVLEDGFKTDLLYKPRNQELDSRFQRVLDLMQVIEDLACKYPELTAYNEILLVNRFLNEQAIYDEQQKKWQSKENKDINSSSLQSAYDKDATYRNKAEKHHSGYVLNLSETCSKENPVQFITDFTLEPNNKSDVNIARERLNKIKENTDASDLYVDGGYYSPDLIEDADKLGISLHYTDMTGRKAPSNKMSINSFHFNEQMEVLSCPQGKIPTRSTYNAKNKTSSSHFSHDDCKGSPILIYAQ